MELRSPNEGVDDEHEEVLCRICRCEEAPGDSLHHPCLCSGSMKYVHKNWLDELFLF